jgi:hypothetical protein
MLKIKRLVLIELLIAVACEGQQPYYRRSANASEGHPVLRWILISYLSLSQLRTIAEGP